MTQLYQLTPDILRKAAKALESHEWLRENYFSFPGEEYDEKFSFSGRVVQGEEPCGMCAAGALIYAASREGIFSEDQKKMLNFQALLFPAKLISEEVTTDNQTGLFSSRPVQLISFNDFIANDKDEVISLLQKMVDFMEQNPEKLQELTRKIPGSYGKQEI